MIGGNGLGAEAPGLACPQSSAKWLVRGGRVVPWLSGLLPRGQGPARHAVTWGSHETAHAEPAFHSATLLAAIIRPTFLTLEALS
jgi:hypothetical protein